MASKFRTSDAGPKTPADSVRDTGAAEKGIFRKEGEYWTIGYGRKVFRFKHSKGFVYIAFLLRHPTTEFHVLDLGEGTEGSSQPSGGRTAGSLTMNPQELEASGIHLSRLGDAGEMLDEQAKRSYKARLVELREELEEIKGLGNSERADRIEEEIATLAAELSRAVGLGGRNRRAASATERARQRAKKAIKTAVERITKADRELGVTLSRCIRTGIYCCYIPDHNSVIEWEFGSTTGIIAKPRGATVLPGGKTSDFGATAELLGPLVTIPIRTSFAGREAELRHLRELVHYALDGLGSIVLLGGGPGVGKTRLALEAAQYASSCGFGFLMGHCYEREVVQPYLPFEHILEIALRETPGAEEFRAAIADNAAELAQIAPRLRHLFPDIPAPVELPPHETRRYLFQVVSETFIRVARRVPLFLLLDDLHWADEPSLALLIHLANRVARFPIVIAATYRDAELDITPALKRTLEELYRTGVSPIRLQGLAEREVALMLRDLSRREPPEQLVKLVFEETQGNAFFIEELYKHLAEEKNLFDSSGQFRDDIKLSEIEVPDKVRLVVSRRLERLGPSTKRVLTAAAVIGRSFSFKLLEALLGETDIDDVLTSIEDAQRMGLIISSSEGPEAPFRFAHEIVRQTLLADASLPRRQRLHLRVADALEKIDASVINDRAAEIALHLVRAGSAADRQRTRDFLTLAGRVAVEAGGYETALSHFESALSRIDQHDLHQRGELLYSMAIAERGLGRWDNAHLRWEEALGIFTAQDDSEAIAKVCFRIAHGLTWAGRWREAGEIAARCLTRLEGAISADRALLLATLGLSKAVEGDYQSAKEAFKMSLTLAEDLSDLGLKGAILAFRLQFNFFFLRLREALEDAYESAELLAAGSGPWPRAQRLCWMQTSLYHLGRVQEAAKAGEELQPLATRIGHVAALSYCRRLEAWTNFGRQPDLIQLEDKLQKDLDANVAAGLDVLVALSHAQLSVAQFFRGNWDNALEHAEAACGPQAPHVMRGLNVGILFRQQAYAGDRDGALAFIRQHSEKLAHAGKANAYGSWAMPVLLTEGFVVLGEYGQAAALYPLVRELIATGTVCMAFISRFPQTIAGVAAAAARQWNAAEQHFHIALRQAQDFPHVVEVAEIQRFYGAMLIERDQPNDCGKARALLIQACDTYNQAGMPRHSAMAKALLNKLAPA